MSDYISLQSAMNGLVPSQKRWKRSGLSPEVIETLQRLGRAHHGLQAVNDLLEAEQLRWNLVCEDNGWTCDFLSDETRNRLYSSQRALVQFIGYLLEDLRVNDHDSPQVVPPETPARHIPSSEQG